MKYLLPVIAAMLALSSCTTVDDPFLQTGALKADGPSLATSASADYALAALPGLPAASVRQSVRTDHIEQTILYANATDLAGENALTVTIGKGGEGFKGAPSQAEVEAEMRTVLSGVRMRVSPVISDNAYGVFGFATGPLGKGGSCLYAWQLARSITPNGGAGLGSGYAAQIRLRYCNPAMPQDRVAALMEGLRIKPVSAQTFETLRHAGGSGAMAAAPVLVSQPVAEQVVEPSVAEVAPVRRKLRRAVSPAMTAEPVEAAQKTVENAVKVPMPGEAAALAAKDAVPVVAEQSASKAIIKPSTVPLPGAVAFAQ
ncbi:MULTISPECIES: cellulose biosynthesis protein BcsN [unclassified Rhizobium]|uniref:cellulose biosynthesis protein BcsN n=1 Tax=unclassified Rhizobium TaxID=2613769 RepID=UPI000714873B|nr:MULTISPECIES: cellulose biosynthesis protein BcsN [unclassified Rhizobium]KQS91069.1 hypothetical protein ASG42_11305 [Rhizobium sp. Leaf391]KQS96080.1 hypothetical protein ASG50_03105 [Rhizobium sp. Leaf386]KQU09845.1 hypothetical protein ASG68_02270 [Rhizobium sp. Leaf453]